MNSKHLVERTLDLRSILLDLVDDKLIKREDANMLMGATRTREQAALHPLTYIATNRFENQKKPGKSLDEITLADWMAQKARMTLFHIDPMKVPVAESTAVMSYAFAKRHGLLCVNVTADVVTIAVTEPFMSDWVGQLQQIVRKEIKKVFALPSDVERFRVEFYSLAHSISGAEAGKNRPASGVTNFEQLLELGTLKEPEANDQHIVNIVDWLLQYAFDQRASDIHLEPRREMGRMRFRIDGVLHNVYELPAHIGGAVPIARPKGELLTVLSVTYPKTRLSEMVLGDTQMELLHRVLHEYRQQSKLREHGLAARRKLLLAGPAGCGKTMTSKALAGELKLPHFAVQLHGLITKFMGETAAKLHAVFEAMKETRGVYLFDEFDAIGGERASKNDVGEIRRVLNSFLQFLEQDESDSLIIAATNNVQILDNALFRRFDDVIVYERPDSAAVRELVSNRLAPFKVPALDWSQIETHADGLSHAEISQACDDAAKEAVLADRQAVDPQVLYRALDSKQQRRKKR